MFDEIAEKIKKVSDIYAARFGIRRDEIWYFLKLQEEIGELAKAYVNSRGGGREGSNLAEASIHKEFLSDEIADVLAHLVLFADVNGINIVEALDRKWLSHLK